MISSEDYVLHLEDGNKIKLPLFTYNNIDDIFDNPTEVYYKGEALDVFPTYAEAKVALTTLGISHEGLD